LSERKLPRSTPGCGAQRDPIERFDGLLKEDPAALFREHVWINPFWEDKILDVVGHMGADRVIGLFCFLFEHASNGELGHPGLVITQ